MLYEISEPHQKGKQNLAKRESYAEIIDLAS